MPVRSVLLLVFAVLVMIFITIWLFEINGRKPDPFLPRDVFPSHYVQ
jgi:hypothetical protein